MSDLALDILGSTFLLRCPDEKWRAFLAALWEPFAGEARYGKELVIRRDPAGWTVGCAWNADIHHRDPWLLANEIRHLMIEEALRLEPVPTLHAAALTKGDATVVIAGESGAGKTTLTLALAEAGWGYLTDDLVLVAAGGVKAFPKPLGIKEPEMWESFAGRLGLGWPGPPLDLFLIPPGALGWRPLDEERPVSLVALLARGEGGEVSVEEITRGVALSDLLAYARPRAAATVSAVASACAGARAVKMRSDDPVKAVALLEEL